MPIKLLSKKENKIHILAWKPRAEGGIQDDWVDKSDVAPDVLMWTIMGQKVWFRGEVGTRTFPIKPPSIVRVSPKKIARIPECLPRQKLNSTHRDLWQKLAPWAPVVVIMIGFIILVVMIG